MKYFNPSYWFKLWVLSAPLFNSENQGIYAKSIDNQNIKDWASKNTSSLESINQEIGYTNSSNNYKLYSLNETNQNIDPFYQSYLDSFSNQHLETSNHKHRHEKSRKRVKRKDDENKKITVSNLILFRYLPNDPRYTEWYSFRTQILFILSDLENENLISRISIEDTNIISRIPIYSINSNNNDDDIFIIPIRLNDSPSYSQTIDKFTCVANPWIRGQYENTSNNDLRLVFRARDFYLQGFIANNNYYYFSDSTTIQYGTTNSINLGYSSNYNVLAGNDIDTISWENIYNSFNTLQNYNRRHGHDSIRQDLVRVILATAESMRFYGISKKINEIYTNSQTISWQSLTSLTQNWLNISNNVSSWLLLFWTILANNQELLQNIATLMAIVDNVKCKHKNAKKQKRNINMCFNSSNKNILVCDLKPQIDKIQGKITSIKILDNDSTENPWVKKGYIFIGTDTGLYTINQNGDVSKRMSIINHVKDIIINKYYNSANIINEKCEIYELKFKDWSYEKKNMESCDLNKELNIYYHNDKAEKGFTTVYEGNSRIDIGNAYKAAAIGCVSTGAVLGVGGTVSGGPVVGIAGGAIGCSFGFTIAGYSVFFTSMVSINDSGQRVSNSKHCFENFNLLNYKKIEFLGNNIYTLTGRGNEEFYGKKITDCINGNFKSKFSCVLLNFTETNFYTWQSLDLKFFQENTKYCFEMEIKQHARNNAWMFANGGGIQMAIGNRIRLYNDEITETQISNPNDRKIREIFEEKNVTKWTDDLSKDINHEQHLSIDNKTNFVTNNITSL
ncbi:ribosome-inactivating family protein [Spiroplasma endosymbiont of Zeiraphera isertana]|uniref:ribosome-inactivating family protein n=1 Tax=Spiroplasma endosymbiont of Zeiraphera isertana TaxID=3066313 RepID=UPI00313E4171